MRTAIIFFALVGAAFAATKTPPQRIVGGSPTTVENYPYMSNMQFLMWGFFWTQFCGGSLITSTAILSAAHCYDGDSPSSWRVLLGTSLASSGGTVHPVSRLILHSAYDSSAINNDIAIVHLATPAVFSNSIGVARIAGPNYNIPDGSPVTTIGWGALYHGIGAPSSEQLLYADLNTINHALCTERYAYLKTQPGYEDWPDITDAMLCAGILDVGGKDACQGDSGGPLAHDGDVLVGVVSWGFSCADAVYPGVNVRVSYFTDWIVQNAS